LVQVWRPDEIWQRHVHHLINDIKITALYEVNPAPHRIYYCCRVVTRGDI